MQYSTNYNMNLPEGYDQFDIGHFNNNTRFLDTKLKTVEDVTTRVKLYPKKLLATLSAGQTSVSFQDSSINNDSLIDIYVSVYGVNPTAVEQTGNTVVISFDVQTASMTVGIVVNNWEE